MSYEGYVQVLCANGHYSTYDCWDDPFVIYDDSEETPICKVCGARLVWRNGVDTTNGCNFDDERGICDCGYTLKEIEGFGCMGSGCGYVKLQEKSPAVMCKCDKCGYSHEIAPATYHIPEKK